uniref:Cytochrome c oxidase subunit 1 n=1 Tax=Stylonychia lemnae TaxID=5949 RepID=A0A3S6K9T2_STYLE|nr:Cox1 [Stylonychia lemnae]
MILRFFFSHMFLQYENVKQFYLKYKNNFNLIIKNISSMMEIYTLFLSFISYFIIKTDFISITKVITILSIYYIYVFSNYLVNSLINKNRKTIKFNLTNSLILMRGFAKHNFAEKDEKKDHKKNVFFTLNLLELSERLFFSLIYVLTNPSYSFKIISFNIRREKFNLSQSFFSFLTLVTIYLFWLKARFSYFTNNWIYTTNHKRIAVNYFWFVILSGIVGMVLATIIRLEFAYPGVGVLAGDSIQYLSLASAHGVIMVFFMIMPLLFGAFANFLLPTQLGVHDVAFPRLNSAAFWFLPGGLLMLCQLVCVDRRYQRMNCFNIREVESLLKRKFFVDLINSKDHRTFLDETAVGLRFKSDTSSLISSNVVNFHFYGPDVDFKIRNIYYFFKPLELDYSGVLKYNNLSLFYKLISYFNVSNFFSYINFFLFKINDDVVVVDNANKIYAHASFFLSKLIYLITRTYLYFKFLILLVVHSVTTAVSYFIYIVDSFFYYVARAIIIFFFVVIRLTRRVFSFIIRDSSYHYLSATHKFSRKLHDARSSLYFKITNVFSIFTKENFFFFISKLYSVSYVSDFSNHLWSLLSFFKQININDINYVNIDINSIIFTDIRRLAVHVPFENNSFLVNVWSTWAVSVNNLLSIIFFLENRNKSNFQLYVSEERYLRLQLANEIRFKEFLSITRINPLTWSLEIYSFFYFLFNLPINSIRLFVYLCLNHLWGFDWGLMYAHAVHFIAIRWFDVKPAADAFTSKKQAVAFLKKEGKNDYERLNASLNNILKYKKSLLMDKIYIVENYFWIAVEAIIDIFYLNSFSIDLIKIYLENCADWLSPLLSTYWFNKIFIFNLDCVFFDIKNFKIFNFFQYLFFYPNKFETFFNWIIKLKNNLPQNISLKSKIFFSKNIKEQTIDSLEETSSEARNLRFNNPVFKYDYKSGDYFPKLYKEAYSFLLPSILSLTSGLRTSPWFLSNTLNELFASSLNVFIDNFEKTEKHKNFEIKPFNINKITNNEAFYNYFLSLEKTDQSVNTLWVSSSSLATKFNKMFLTSSMQQRIYGNWRQLKFTREAWRCKLLATRHQKTLFKRYMNEDGIFWSIERNAKDLIPGWAMITPFSSRTRYTAVGKTDIGLMGVLLVLNSSIISGANFLVTYRYLSTLNNRKMRDARAFFTEAVMVASWMMILANPMLVIGIVMLLSDRHWQTSFFDYSGGGDTVLFQHMFWFFGHPEVYVIIIPTFGFTNTMVSYYLKKRVSARASLLYSLYTIAFLGFFVWGHHMYMVGLSHTTRMLFSTLTVMISVPAATKIMHWCVTTANSAFVMELPLLFTYTFIFFFVSGGISGMCVAHTGMDVLFHDTFYVIGHFHVMLAGGAMFASFGAFYFYFPAIFGVKYSRVYAYLHYTYYLVGQLMTVAPMFWLGYAGMPRRVLDYPAAFGGWHSVISAGHMLNVAGLMAFFIMIFDSLRQARAATRNNFGIGRYNTRLNFYLYEISRLSYLQQKSLTFFRFIANNRLKLNNQNFINYEPYETILFSYVFIKK